MRAVYVIAGLRALALTLTPTTAHAWEYPFCEHDGCYRNLIDSRLEEQAKTFCPAFLAGTTTASAAIPTEFNNCNGDVTAVSSACSCITYSLTASRSSSVVPSTTSWVDQTTSSGVPTSSHPVHTTSRTPISGSTSVYKTSSATTVDYDSSRSSASMTTSPSETASTTVVVPPTTTTEDYSSTRTGFSASSSVRETTPYSSSLVSVPATSRHSVSSSSVETTYWSETSSVASSPSRSTSSDTQTASIPKSSTSSVASSSGYHISSTNTARTPSAGSFTSSIATPSSCRSYSSSVESRYYRESLTFSADVSSAYSVPPSSVGTTLFANSSTTTVSPATTESGSSSAYVEGTSYTTSTIYATTVRVVSCAPEYAECLDKSHTTTETIAVSTTVCAVTETTPAAAEGSVAPRPFLSYPATSYTTSTVYAATVRTVSYCASGVSECRIKPGITTETLAVSTIIRPVSHDVPNGFTTYIRPSSAHQPSDVSGSLPTPVPETSITVGTYSAQPEAFRLEESVLKYTTTATISTAESAPAANSATAGPVQVTSTAAGLGRGIELAAIAVVVALCNS